MIITPRAKVTSEHADLPLLHAVANACTMAARRRTLLPVELLCPHAAVMCVAYPNRAVASYVDNRRPNLGLGNQPHADETRRRKSEEATAHCMLGLLP